jgi:Lon protease-like protein
MSKPTPVRLRLFPLNSVLFPGAVLNVHVFEPRYKRMISECLELEEPFGVVLIAEGEEADDPRAVPCKVGTLAEITDITPLGGGRFYVSTKGKQRFRIDDIVEREPYLCAEVTYLDEESGDPEALPDLVQEIREVFTRYLRLLIDFSGVRAEVRVPEDPMLASFLIADTLQVADMVKQRLLEISDTEKRLNIELEFLRRLLPQLRNLLERRRELPPGNEARQKKTLRSDQERYFGKFFSLN